MGGNDDEDADDDDDNDVSVVDELAENLMNEHRLKEIKERADLMKADSAYAKAMTPEHDPDEAAIGLTITMARKRILNILYQLERFVISDEQEELLKAELFADEKYRAGALEKLDLSKEE